MSLLAHSSASLLRGCERPFTLLTHAACVGCRDWVDGEEVQRLVCERGPQPLQTCVRRINGHVVHLTAYEDARGELGFHMTVPQLGPQVSFDWCRLMSIYA